MGRTAVADLQSGENIDQIFLLFSKELRTARNGSLYLVLELGDRTGRVQGRMWDARRELFETFQPDDFVRVKGRVETYQNRLQVIVSAVERRPGTEVDAADFLPSTNKDVDEMFARLVEISKTVRNTGLRELLDSFLGDTAVSAKLRRAPAAVQYHHAFFGGLLEHTLSVAEFAVLAADRYPDLDRDVLVAGAILHDIGKIDELNYERSFNYTDAGGLLGHLYLGARMIQERAREIAELPQQILESLLHVILSHHGEYEYQSPKLPVTAEAIAIHHMDNLDAKLCAFRAAMLNDRDPASRWTEWNRMFERRLFKGHDAGEPAAR